MKQQKIGSCGKAWSFMRFRDMEDKRRKYAILGLASAIEIHMPYLALHMPYRNWNQRIKLVQNRVFQTKCLNLSSQYQKSLIFILFVHSSFFFFKSSPIYSTAQYKMCNCIELISPNSQILTSQDQQILWIGHSTFDSHHHTVFPNSNIIAFKFLTIFFFAICPWLWLRVKIPVFNDEH